MLKKIAIVVCSMMITTISYASGAKGNVRNGKEIVNRTNCAACHGENLNHPIDSSYPKLAGQFADYTYYALRAYQQGNNNKMFGRDNNIMRAQVQSLSDKDLRDIAAYIETIPNGLIQKHKKR